MGIKEKILLVEDDRSITALITAILSYQGYQVIHADSGEMAINLAASHAPDLILLDLGLPDFDGIRVLTRIREWSDIPVIIVSARNEESIKVAALDGGANDYVTKPFGNGELLARVRAAIRIHRRSCVAGTLSVFTNGGLTVDYEKRTVSVDKHPVHLTPIEYKIVVQLSQNVGKVLTHEHLLSHLWGPHAGESQILRVNVANIRRKIEKKPAAPEYIVTEVGVGYRMAEIEEEHIIE